MTTVFSEARAARAQAQVDADGVIAARMKDPAVVDAAKISLEAVKMFVSQSFSPAYFVQHAPDEPIAVRFGKDPATGKAWDPAVAALVALAINQQTGDDAGFAVCETFYAQAAMGRPAINGTYLIIAETADAAAAVPRVTAAADLPCTWPFDDVLPQPTLDSVPHVDNPAPSPSPSPRGRTFNPTPVK